MLHGTMLNYWDHDAETITVNAVAINKDDPTAIHGQFDSSADATVTNLLIYLHSYRPYTQKFKCPVKLTGAVGTNDIHLLGEGFLHLPAPNMSDFLAVLCFYSPHLSSTIDINILGTMEVAMTRQSTPTKIWITIGTKVRLHILPTEACAPIL